VRRREGERHRCQRLPSKWAKRLDASFTFPVPLATTLMMWLLFSWCVKATHAGQHGCTAAQGVAVVGRQRRQGMVVGASFQCVVAPAWRNCTVLNRKGLCGGSSSSWVIREGNAATLE
jgi:hypothetical protein